jgi:hypothetical protein
MSSDRGHARISNAEAGGGFRRALMLFAGAVGLLAPSTRGQCIQWNAVGTTPGGGSWATEAVDLGAGPKLCATLDDDVLQWNGSSWTTTGDTFDDLVTALCAYDTGYGPVLYAAGYFRNLYYSGAPMWHVGALINGVWVEPGGGLPTASLYPGVWAMQAFDDGSGPKLYVGGAFTTYAGFNSNNIVRWDGANWSSVGGGLTGAARAMCVYDDGGGSALYVSMFDQAVSAATIVKWNGTAWSSIGSGFTGGAPGITSMAVFDDGSGPALYAGGSFTSANGVPANGIAKWDGTSWSALAGVPLTPLNDITAMTVHDDGTGPALYEHSRSGLYPLFQGVAMWDGTTWAGLGIRPDCEVRSLRSFDDGQGGGPALYAAGCFYEVGHVISPNVARWGGACLHRIDPLCFGDGTFSSCPCSNYGSIFHGCRNSSASQGAQLTASGATSPDTLVLSSSFEPATSSSLFLQSDVLSSTAASLGAGILCLGGQIRRLYQKSAVGGVVQAPQPGDLSITQRSSSLGDPILPGAARFYQVWYRDPVLGFCLGTGSNVSNGLRVVW